MAAFNEEIILEKKLESIYAQTIDMNRVSVYLGSDDSTDRTNEIIETSSRKYSNIKCHIAAHRLGKPALINTLAEMAISDHGDNDMHVFIITDANVILHPDAITKMIQHFRNTEIGLVDAHMIYRDIDNHGISKPENTYLNTEVKLKHGESILWQKMIGPFGGCYAVRSDLYTPVPSHHLVDDFYIAMSVFDQGKLAINDLSAICYEDVSHSIAQEYKRKKRISSGNWQNLRSFIHLCNPFSSLGFALISHKVLRWVGPILLLVMMITSLILFLAGSVLFKVMFVGILITLVGIPIMDKLLASIHIHFTLFRSIRYFSLMNVAVFHGLFEYIRGIDSGIWQPTQRKVLSKK